MMDFLGFVFFMDLFFWSIIFQKTVFSFWMYHPLHFLFFDWKVHETILKMCVHERHIHLINFLLFFA